MALVCRLKMKKMNIPSDEHLKFHKLLEYHSGCNDTDCHVGVGRSQGNDAGDITRTTSDVPRK